MGNRRIVTGMILLLLATLLPVAALQAQELPPRTDTLSTPPSPRRFAPSIPPLGQFDGPTCSLDATIYELRVVPEQIGRLDLDALTRAAASAQATEKALADMGTAKPLYRVCQSVRLSGDSIMIGTNKPFVTGTNTSAQGRTVNSIQYNQIGAMINLAGQTSAAGRFDVDLRIELSTAGDSTTAISDNVQAPTFHQVMLTHKGPIEADRPLIVVSVDAASPEAGKAVAYVGRITFGPPQPALAPAPGK